MADRFNDVVDAGYEADADCPRSASSSRGLDDALVMLEDPLGLRLAKRRTTSRRGIFRKVKPRSLEIRQGRLQPQPQQPPPQDAVDEAPPSQEPPAGVPSVEEPSFVVPPFASSSVPPLPTASATLPEPESESNSSSESDGEDSPSPTTSTFPPGVGAPPSQTSIGSPSATDSLTSRPVAQEGKFDPSRQAQDPTLGIAFGSVGAGAIVICVLCSIWFLCHYRRKRRKSMAPPSSIPPNTNSYVVQANNNLPPDRGPPRRSPSSLMDELMAAAYDVEHGAQGDQQSPAPHGYLNEKRYDPSQQLPILQPAPVVQPNVRWSIASWVRRHNPLRLNPVNGRNSMYSTTSSSSTPPVPAVPAQFQSQGRPSGDDDQPLVPPPLVLPRVASSHYYEAGGNGQSPISVSARNSGTWLQQNTAPGRPQQQQPLPQQQQHHFFNARAVSMAQTEHTTTNMSDSTWASWGAGVSRPQQQPQQQQQPPETPRRAWIEKCVKLGGWK